MAGRETVRAAGQEQGGDILSDPHPMHWKCPPYEWSSRFWTCRAAERRGHERRPSLLPAEIGHFQDAKVIVDEMNFRLTQCAVLV